MYSDRLENGNYLFCANGALGIVAYTQILRSSDLQIPRYWIRPDSTRRSLEAPRALEAATRDNLMKKVGEDLVEDLEQARTLQQNPRHGDRRGVVR